MDLNELQDLQAIFGHYIGHQRQIKLILVTIN